MTLYKRGHAMGSLRNNDTVNIKGVFNWIYSLFGMWWISVGLGFISICIIGISDTLFVSLPFFASLIIWIKKSENSVQKIKDFFNSSVDSIKEWWDKRPKLTE